MDALNDAALDLIKSFEGLRLVAYQDSGGVWTIGYGHTHGVTEGMTCSEDQATKWLMLDVADAMAVVRQATEVTLTPNQFGALVSFEYNTGAYPQSTMCELINRKDFAGAAQEFPKWVYAGGVVLEGLVRRRAAEQKLFLQKG
jgi:lysozyme